MGNFSAKKKNGLRWLGRQLATVLIAACALSGGAMGETQPPAPTAVPTVGGTPGSMTYEDWAREYYQIRRIPKQFVRIEAGNRVRLVGPVKGVYELVGEDDGFYLVRNLPIEDPESPGHEAWLDSLVRQAEKLALEEYLRTVYLVSEEPDTSLVFTDRLRFEPVSGGLPNSGRWQMSLDIADMNEDGRLDLVLPPPRGGNGKPVIMLQGARFGEWQPWAACRWPHKDFKLDYGSVRAADFDGDGHLDIVLAAHFADTVVMYGDGKGNFERAVRLPKGNQAVTARAVVVADFNKDGRLDVATLAELDVDVGKGQRLESGLVNVVFNLPGGWILAGSQGLPERGHGDALSAADLDGDGFPELLLTSRQAEQRQLVLRNRSGGMAWEAIAENAMPFDAYVFAVAAGRVDDTKGRDVVYCFEQFNPMKGGEPAQACVLYHFHNAQGRFEIPKRGEIIWKTSGYFENPKGIALGDLDGDGRNDLVVVFPSGKVLVLLQGATGQWLEEKSPELALENTDLFDVRIADLDGDKKAELILMGSPREQKPVGGGVFVFKTGRPGP